ncbi:MAG: FTR1 family protein [Gemmatimonadales bacterium]
MKMILSVAALAVSTLAAPLQAPDSVPDVVPAVRRVAATAQLASQEYRVGIVNGRVVSQAEVDEARLFLQESRRSAALLPTKFRLSTISGIDSLIALVSAAGSPDSVDARVKRLTTWLSTGLGVALDQVPPEAPSLARGAQVFRTNCASCHGELGRGDGPMAKGMQPKPADLSDTAELRDQSPLDYYRRVSIGVVGTAMPAFETRLSPEDRWAVALYASVLRLPNDSGSVPATLQSFGNTGRMSDSQLLAALGERNDESHGLPRVAAVRRFRADGSTRAEARVFTQVRAQIESVYALARTGDTSASSRAFDAYMTFEQVERAVQAKNPGLASDLEAGFASLRTRVAGGATGAELDRIRRQLDADLENAERTLADQPSALNLFIQSFVILLREGFEAILLVGALMTFLAKMGAAHRKRDIHIGVGAAAVASLLTAFALETIFHLTSAKREALEGLTMALATVVLFYVSYWLLSKMEVAKWNHFVKSKVQDALTSGSGLALASAAFLAVYREGFETVLFYKALFVTGGSPAATMPILAGILLGSLVMVLVYLAINRFGLRLPLKPFFGVTSGFLYYMAFVFAGKAVAELQEGGMISTTIVLGGPRLPALGIYPTVESLLAQGVLVALLVLALAWTFVIEPRRRHRTGSAVPEPLRREPVVAIPAPVPPEASRELLRSLERMEADLSEMRSEVERMKGNLTDAPESRSRQT